MRAIIIRVGISVAAVAAVAVVTAIAGCSSDPCGSKSGFTCVTLHVEASNPTALVQLQQLKVASTIGTGASETKESPETGGGEISLPFDVALYYPLAQSGSVTLSVDGIVGNTVVGHGDGSFGLVSGTHASVTVMLNGTSLVPGDMGSLGGNIDMGPNAGLVVSGSFDWFGASKSVLAAVTHTNQTLQIYSFPAGQLLATLDSGVDAQSLFVTDSVVLYCASPTTIGATTNKSCTLKMWRPSDTSGTTLGTGVYPFAPRASTDGTVLAWSENVDATATHANGVSWFNGTKTTLGTQIPIVNLGAIITNNVLFGIVPSATAGEFDIVRQTAAGTAAAIHICQNCDQFVMKNDGSMIAARLAPTNNLGKLVVAASSVATVNGLGTAATGSTTSDVSSLIDYFDTGSVMYFNASGAGNNIREWVESSNVVTTRLADGSAMGTWGDNGSFLAFYKTIDANGVGDLYLLPSLSGAAVFFGSGGVLADLTSDGRFAFTVEPDTSAADWYTEIGSGLDGTPVATMKAPSYAARILNPTRVAFFSTTNTYALVDYVSGVTFTFDNVLVTQASIALSRILLLSQATATNGIFAYTY